MTRMSVIQTFVVCLVVGLGMVVTKNTTLPKDFKICKRGDNECLKEAINEGIKIFATKGVPSLNIKPIDPHHLDKVNLHGGSIKLTLTNQQLFGWGSADITQVTSEMGDKTHVLGFQFHIPAVALRGDYTLSGRVLVLPIRGHGKNNLTMTDFKGSFVMNSHVVSRDGEDFLEVDDYLIDFDQSRLYIDFTNLFDGNKALADNMAVVLNENWRAVLGEVKPAVADMIKDILKDVLGTVYMHVSYANLFPK